MVKGQRDGLNTAALCQKRTQFTGLSGLRHSTGWRLNDNKARCGARTKVEVEVVGCAHSQRLCQLLCRRESDATDGNPD